MSSHISKNPNRVHWEGEEFTKCECCIRTAPAMTTTEIAAELGISRQGVEAILDRALRKLAKNTVARELWGTVH